MLPGFVSVCNFCFCFQSKLVWYYPYLPILSWITNLLYTKSLIVNILQSIGIQLAKLLLINCWILSWIEVHFPHQITVHPDEINSAIGFPMFSIFGAVLLLILAWLDVLSVKYINNNSVVSLNSFLVLFKWLYLFSGLSYFGLGDDCDVDCSFFDLCVDFEAFI